MICTFGDTTDVVWWRELALPTRTIVGRDGRLLTVDWGSAGLGVRGPGGGLRPLPRTRRDGRSSRPRSRMVEQLRDSGALLGEPRPITHPVKFYEKGERPLEIVSSRQWFVKTLPLRERLLERGEELHWHPPYMEHRYRVWVEGLNERLEHLPAAVLRCPLSGLVPGRRDRRGRLRQRRSSPTSTACRSTLRPTCPTATARTSAASRAASSASPTSWTPGPPPRSPRRSPPDGRTTRTSSAGCSRWTSGPRHTTSSAPGCSRRWSAPSSSTPRCRGRTWRSRAGCSTRTARRCPSRRGTWSPRCPSSSSTAPTRSATGPPAAGRVPTPRSTRAR